MSWVGHIMLGAYLTFILGTVVFLFATTLLATSAEPSLGKGGASSQVAPRPKTIGIE